MIKRRKAEQEEVTLDGVKMVKIAVSEGRMYSFWLNPEKGIVRRRNDVAYKKNPEKGWQNWEVSIDDWNSMKNSQFIILIEPKN